MAVDNTTRLTLTELLNRKAPDGNLAVIANVLEESNPIIQEMPMFEANNTTVHEMTRSLSLPSGTWRRLNQGVSKERAETVKVSESIGMLESYSEVDKDLVAMSPNSGEFRMGEARMFLEGLSQTAATAIIYGNSGTDPEQIMGLAPRMASLDADGLVIGQGGTGSDTTSIYVVQWGEGRAFGIYPKGSPAAGLQHRDLGEVTLLDSSSNPYQGYRDHFKWNFGLAVKDTRCIARLANIESSGTSNTFDEDNLITLLNRMPNDGEGAVIYVNAAIKTQMQIKLKDKANVNYTEDGGNGLSGRPLLRFQGIPIRKVEAIVNTETAIS